MSTVTMFGECDICGAYCSDDEPIGGLCQCLHEYAVHAWTHAMVNGMWWTPIVRLGESE